MTLRLLCSSLFVLGLLASCEGDPDLALSVDLRTDYVAGVEFVGARLTIDGTVADETLSGAESYVDGRRLFEVEGLGSSARRGLTVSLLNGAGGVLAELLARTALDVLPAPDVKGLVKRSGIAPLLAGYRGEDPADADALESVADSRAPATRERWRRALSASKLPPKRGGGDD